MDMIDTCTASTASASASSTDCILLNAAETAHQFTTKIEDVSTSSSNTLLHLPKIIRHEPTTYRYLQQQRSQGYNEESVDLDGIFRDTAIGDDDDDVTNIDQSTTKTISSSSCSLYMAQSSIPNSGIGIYTGRDFTKGDVVDPRPQVALPLIQIDENDYYSTSTLKNYPWHAKLSGTHLEDKEAVAGSGVVSLNPNVGMLANSHLGLVNVKQTSCDGVKSLIGSSDRSKDESAGAGAYSLYNHASFHAVFDMEGGEELFVDYGKGYFHGREERFGMVFPTLQNYREADRIVRDFVKSHGWDEDTSTGTELTDTVTEELKEEWRGIVAKLTKEGDEDDGANGAERMRVAYALPDAVEDLKLVAKIGTARYSIPESSRSIEWLEENGLCLDNLRMGKSNIPLAGYGKSSRVKSSQVKQLQCTSTVGSTLSLML